MAKAKTTFECTNCGAKHSKMLGRCHECNEWGTIAEAIPEGKAPAGRGGRKNWAGAQSRLPRRLDQVEAGADKTRIATGLGEFDRVLGGGLVVGGVVLLGGDPGIGKSTVLLQASDAVGRLEKSVLYVTGEESLEQVAARCLRLELDPSRVTALAETQVEQIEEAIMNDRPDLLIVDSIQTLYTEDITSAPGTVSQVRESAARLIRMAKQTGVCVIMVGHVTKDGSIAGPRVLEHMVDTVISFEGEPHSPYRLMRSIKNRFGAANELGAFEMTERGLLSVDNPSALFLSQDRTSAKGSCVSVLQEGPRAMLLEIQALVDDMQANNPRRLAVGVDGNRVTMILAILHQHCGLEFNQYDVFVNAVGGIRATEPACDLAVAMALVSSIRSRALPADLCCFGELGLTGEVRPVQMAQQRMREAIKLGFRRIVMPKRCMPDEIPKDIEVVGVRDLVEAVSALKEWEDIS